jgi:hypothetical protein
MRLSCKKFAVALALSAAFSLSQAISGSAQSGAPPIPAKFDSVIDTKSAKVGDAVAAKTLKTIKLPNGLEIPKGSKVLGRVLGVQTKQAGNGTSWLAIKLDHIEVKTGGFLPIQGLIVSIAPLLDPQAGHGYDTILNRSAGGPATDVAPLAMGGQPVDVDVANLPKGSTLEGVALALDLDKAGCSELRGVKKELRLDSSVAIQVELK